MKWIRQPKPKNDISELLKPLGDKSWRGNVWHPIVMNVLKEEGPTPITPTPTSTLTPTPTLTPTHTPTPTLTPTHTPTPTLTPTHTPTSTLTPTPTPSMTSTPSPTPSATPSGLDPDAQAYIAEINTQGGSLTASEETAIDTYFVELKAAGLFSKFYYLHLFFGGTAGSNGINAINPGTYDLTWQGTWTHNSSGSITIQSNSNYAESGFVISSASPSTTQSDFSFGYMVDDISTVVTSYGYQGVGTNTTNYMITGADTNTGGGWTNGYIESYWSNTPGKWMPSTPYQIHRGIWNSVSRNGVSSWYEAAKIKSSAVSSGMDFRTGHTTTFNPSATPYDLNLFRINGLNLYTIGGTALMNYASTYLSPSDMNTFMEKTNDLLSVFGTEIFT